MKFPCPDKWIDDMHAGIRQRPTELGFQDMRHTFHHEIDNGLRCVDNAVRVCDILGESLKKTSRRTC